MKKTSKSRTNVTLALAALFVAGVLTTSGAYAMFGEGFMQNEDVANAIENNDYDAFLTAVSELSSEKAMEWFTEERFQSIVERSETMESIKTALDNNDYSAWVEAVSATPRGEEMVELITEDKFPTLVELHETQENAMRLAQELGLDSLGHGQMKMGRGYGGIGCPMVS